MPYIRRVIASTALLKKINQCVYDYHEKGISPLKDSIRYLECEGKKYKWLGSGSMAVVFALNNKKVIKIAYDDHCWDRYLQFVSQNKNNPHVPKIFGTTKGNIDLDPEEFYDYMSWSITIMEFLVPLEKLTQLHKVNITAEDKHVVREMVDIYGQKSRAKKFLEENMEASSLADFLYKLMTHFPPVSYTHLTLPTNREV